MATTKDIKQSNFLHILRSLRTDDCLAKSDLARITGLTGTTVHYLVDELLTKGVLVDRGVSASSGGRKPSLYALNANFGLIVGVSIRLDHASIAVFDLMMKTMSQQRIELDLVNGTVSDTLETVAGAIESLIGTLSKSRVIGIGINVPGPVDVQSGTVSRLAGASKWDNIPVRDFFRNRFGVQTVVDKDTCSGLVLVKSQCEHVHPNLVFLSTRDGLGTAIMINGTVYRGSHFIAGEIGHNTVAKTGRKCSCGNTDCLELFTSDPGLARNLAQAATDAERTQVLNDALVYMRDAIAGLIRTYDPDEIVIDSEWVAANKEQFFSVLDTMYEDDRLIDRSFARISLAETKDLLMKSAAMLVLEQEFNSIETSQFLN